MNISQIFNTKPECYRLIKKYYRDKGVALRDEALKNEIISNISLNSKVLDAGCGYDAAVISQYSDFINESVGVDLLKDFKVKKNIKTFSADLKFLPFKDNYFDLIISRSVCEHLEKPMLVFQELKRVLKPGGKIIISTPNKFYYSSIISAFLPTSFKKYLLKKIYSTDSYDNFPTFYRCNTKNSIDKIANESGLQLEKFLTIRHYPYYLMFSVTLFKIGMLYDRFITRLGLDFLQSNFLFVLVKKAL